MSSWKQQAKKLVGTRAEVARLRKEVDQLQDAVEEYRRLNERLSDKIGTVAGDQAVEAKPGDQGPDCVGELNAVEAGSGHLQLGAQPRLLIRPGALNGSGILQEVPLELHDTEPLINVGRGDHIDAEAEPVEQLRAQLPLLGVHRAH